MTAFPSTAGGQPSATHDRACAARIRARELANAGHPAEPDPALLHRIANLIHTHCGHHPLKAHRLAQGWTVPQAVTAFHASGDRQRLKRRGLGERSWREWEAGTKRPDDDYIDRLSRLFHTNIIKLGYATDHTPLAAEGIRSLQVVDPTATRHDVQKEYRSGSSNIGRRAQIGGARHDPEDVVRRRILIQQALTAFAAGAAGPALNAIRQGLISSVTGREPGELDVDDWERTAQQYGAAYFTEQPAALVESLAAELADLQGDIHLASDAQRPRLSRSAALLAAVMAMSQVNLGEFPQSWLWWRAARRMADSSGDPAVRTLVIAHDATHALYDRRPLSAALARAGEALAIGGTIAYAGTGEALGAQAQTLAIIGRTDEARSAVTQLTDLFGRLPSEATQESTTIFTYPETRLWHCASYVHTHLADTPERDERAREIATARTAQAEALALYPIPRLRSRAQVELHAARCLVLDGDFDDGANHAQAVIGAVPVQHRTAMVLGMAEKVFYAIPTPERVRPAVAGLREMLALPGMVET